MSEKTTSSWNIWKVIGYIILAIILIQLIIFIAGLIFMGVMFSNEGFHNKRNCGCQM